MKSNYEDVNEFMADLNKLRLASKNKWFGFAGTVKKVPVIIKSYNTGYLQICRVNGIDQAPPMEMNVGTWKAFIEEAIRRHAYAVGPMA